MKLALRYIAWFVFGLFGVAWLLFVWPTQWRYYKSGSQNLRVNRFTGRTELLSQGGWRQDQPPANPVESPMVINGVVVDLPLLAHALSQSESRAVQAYLGTLPYALRYRDDKQVLQAINAIANDPSLTEEQKQLATKVLGQAQRAFGP